MTLIISSRDFCQEIEKSGEKVVRDMKKHIEVDHGKQYQMFGRNCSDNRSNRLDTLFDRGNK